MRTILTLAAAGAAAMLMATLIAGEAAAQAPAHAATPSARARPAPAADRASREAGKPTGPGVTEAGEAGDVMLTREVFTYEGAGRRDPFASLMTKGSLRPMVTDLRLVAVAFDETGQGSVAIMRDLETKEQYRVKVGQVLGRMRVAQIRPRQVVFTIDEFGYSRQEVLALGDSTQARTQ